MSKAVATEVHPRNCHRIFLTTTGRLWIEIFSENQNVAEIVETFKKDLPEIIKSFDDCVKRKMNDAP